MCHCRVLTPSSHAPHTPSSRPSNQTHAHTHTTRKLGQRPHTIGQPILGRTHCHRTCPLLLPICIFPPPPSFHPPPTQTQLENASSNKAKTATKRKHDHPPPPERRIRRRRHPNSDSTQLPSTPHLPASPPSPLGDPFPYSNFLPHTPPLYSLALSTESGRLRQMVRAMGFPLPERGRHEHGRRPRVVYEGGEGERE